MEQPLLRYVRPFFAAVRKRWFAILSGALGVILSLGGPFLESPVNRALAMIFGSVGIAGATFLAWRDERIQVERLEREKTDLLAANERLRSEPPLMPADEAQDAEIAYKVSLFDNPVLHDALEKIALSGEAMSNENGLNTIRLQTGWLIAEGVVTRVKAGWVAPLKRWASRRATARRRSTPA